MADTSAPTIWTVRELLNWTTEYLANKGIESPRLDVQILLASVLKCSRIELIARSHDEPTDAEKSRFRELVRSRSEGCPVAYLVGSREFYLLSFDVSPAVLIPRPDTETLVLEAIKTLKSCKPESTVLDLGTGSGCIAISIAHQCKSARVTAVDLSPDALDIAKGNAKKHAVAERLTFLRGDLFQPLPADARFDLIVSNPPYITHAEFDTLAVDVREHEPKLALDGGPDGLAYYRRIAAEAAKWLKPDGQLLLEIGSTQEPAVRALLESAPNLGDVRSVKDMAGRWRVMIAKRTA